jgi:hypothetical protein
MSLPTLLIPGSLRTHGTDSAEASKLTPLAYIQSWLRARMPEFGGRSGALADRVLIVRAETGSGKSTVLPVGILRILRAEATPARQRYRGPGIICTQPRVLTAIMLAHDVAVARNPDIVLGETVGYQTKAASTPRATALTYATAGVLAAQLNALTDSELMDQYRFIIVDEAHERTVDSDFILMQLRYFYQRNEGNIKLPFLLLASATFNPLRYATYFGIGAANIVEVHGRSHKITTHWPSRGFNDYPRAAAELAHRIHTVGLEDRPGRSDILIFMPGAREQLLVARVLKQLQRDELAAQPESATYIILILNREVVLSQTGDYTLTFLPPDELPKINGKRPLRRIILSTVVAETGITINTLRYVIDSGWNRNIESYPPWGAAGNITRPAAQSRITQRRGRCGRLFPGDFFPLYTQAVYDALDSSQLPDIVSQGASELFLSLVAAQQRQKLLRGDPPEFRVEDIALLDPPPPEILLNNIRSALTLGMISMRAPVPTLRQHDMVMSSAATSADAPKTVYGLTELGLIGSRFMRIKPEGVRVILAGYAWGVAASDLITAVAMFGTPMAHLLPKNPAPLPAGSPRAKLPAAAGPLLASLPPSLRARVSDSHVNTDVAAYYRTRLLLADDFAEAVMIFDAFAAQLVAADGNIAAVAAWCADCGLQFDAMVKFTYAREEIAEEMAGAGLNFCRLDSMRLSQVPVEEFTPALRRFKRCLFDGLVMNLMRYSADSQGYVQHAQATPLRVRGPALFTDAMSDHLASLRIASVVAPPQWIVTDQIRLGPARRSAEDTAPPLLYTAETNLVCVLDGYVDFDPDNLLVREFASI